MGIMGYYRRFIEAFSGISYPIISLQNKCTKFLGSKKCQERFENIKHLLMTKSILRIPYPYKDFVVCTDVFLEGLGGVLLQEDYIIRYESRKLKEHEWNYAPHELELDAIIRALRMWRHYLI